jgi:hypothetical protein
VEYRYERVGSDTTGLLAFNEVTLNGQFEPLSNPSLYSKSIFAQFFRKEILNFFLKYILLIMSEEYKLSYQDQDWYEKNKEKVALYNKKYYETNVKNNEIAQPVPIQNASVQNASVQTALPPQKYNRKYKKHSKKTSKCPCEL